VNATYSKNMIKKFTEYIDNWDTWGQDSVPRVNTDIAFSPSVIANGLVEYEVVKKLTIGWNTKYIGKQYMDNTSNENRAIDAYLVNDLRFNYVIKPKFVKEIAFSFMINNILNSMYVSNGWTYTYLTGGKYFTENYYFPQAGRNVMAGIKVKF
jgi:iron complex outermembrane recepter protein